MDSFLRRAGLARVIEGSYTQFDLPTTRLSTNGNW